MSADNQLVHAEDSRPIVIVIHLRNAYSKATLGFGEDIYDIQSKHMNAWLKIELASGISFSETLGDAYEKSGVRALG